jgi:ribosomal subunit interface protein
MSTGSCSSDEEARRLPGPKLVLAEHDSGRSGVDFVVKGRNVVVPEHFRTHVAEKLQKMERYDHKLIEVSVELHHERNRRQQGHCQRVEITCVSRGPVIRAEACAADFYSALDVAMNKLETRMRRGADRRRVHRGRHAPVSVAAATAALVTADFPVPAAGSNRSAALALADRDDAGNGAAVAYADRAETPFADPERGFTRGGAPSGFDDTSTIADEDELIEGGDDQPWRVVRMKEHPNEPMTVEDALFQMELVGHDFYLFFDKDSGRPSVVYRRRGYDYGVLCLAVAV